MKLLHNWNVVSVSLNVSFLTLVTVSDEIRHCVSRRKVIGRI